MWNSYWSGRSRRDVPQVNYNESSEEEDDFGSPLQSPTRPVNTRQGSPVELAIPTLNDNVDEELEAVSQQLLNVGHTHTFRGTRPLGARPEPEGNEVSNQEVEAAEVVSAEEVVEGVVLQVEEPVKLSAGNDGNEPCGEDESANEVREVGDNIAAVMPDDNAVNFDQENGQDGDKSTDLARAIKIEFEPHDIKFWFAQLEAEMDMAAIKSQWMKKTVLQRNLPNKQKEDVKAFLLLQKAEAGATIYYDIKTELVRIYAKKPQDSYKQALTRTMVGLPSQLGYQLVNDVCKKPAAKLVGCCCAGHVQALWSMQLPVNVRGHISDMEFSAATYKDIFQSADRVYL